MRILDINDNELTEEQIDLHEGYLENDKIFKEHHEEIPAIEKQWHYGVSAFYFDDGTNYIPESEDDPRILAPEDPHSPNFEYIPADGEEKRNVRGMELKEIVDVEYKEAIPAWDEYEDIKRYKLYSEEEKEAREETRRQEERKELLLSSGLERIEELEKITSDHSGKLHDQAITREMDMDLVSQNFTSTSEEIQETNENLTETISTVDDLVLTMADILGGEL